MKSYLLFTSTTCVKCPAFKRIVSEKISFEGKTVDQTFPEFGSLVQKHQISAAPTLIIFEDDQEIFRTSEEYDLEQFLANM